ncbi:MAG TPA: hypothetical protein VJJ82_03085 [Candidatus Nanoarchaeia archaeon]|nr:hypothetical protein [Candidatus Nanoarchaeia archaeon]
MKSVRFWFGLVMAAMFLLWGGASITGFSVSEPSGSSGALVFLIAGLGIAGIIGLNFYHSDKEATD